MLHYGKDLLEPSLGIRPNLLKWMPSRPMLSFDAQADNPASVRAWQKRARRQLELCLGDPVPAVPPRPRVLERKQLDGYTRTTFTIATGPGIRALCWLLLPDGASDASPLPAMIATPGHGKGAKDLLAMDIHGKPRKEGEGYQKDYALAALRHGVAVLVVEPLGFGERRDPKMLSSQTAESGCQAGVTIAMSLGTTLMRIRMNDLIRGLDHLQTLPMINSRRIGMMGISGGGQMTLWTSALERRLKLAIVSGYMNTFRDSVMAMHHCVCNFVPGMLKYFEMSDLAMMAAPRPMLFQSGTRDEIFPIKASRKAVATIRRHYKTMGFADRIEQDVFEGEHQWSPNKVGPFLDKWL